MKFINAVEHRIKSMKASVEDITKALSKSTLLEVNEAKTMLRRKEKFQKKETPEGKQKSIVFI